jgi:hypothetical protein
MVPQPDAVPACDTPSRTRINPLTVIRLSITRCDDCLTPVPDVPAELAASAGLLLCATCNGGTAVARGNGVTWQSTPVDDYARGAALRR